MKTLLLNFTYQPLSFINERSAIKLILKDKVEIINNWDTSHNYPSGMMQHPSVLRMKYMIKYIPVVMKYNSHAVFKRDKMKCQYCGFKFKTSDLSIDHILPQSRGGKSGWLNCVTACKWCNNKKGNKLPEEADMKLISSPKIPNFDLLNDYEYIYPKHHDWKIYLNIED
jgi:5-methylcytosine-specific restriction endonuclease McrA